MIKRLNKATQKHRLNEYRKNSKKQNRWEHDDILEKVRDSTFEYLDHLIIDDDAKEVFDHHQKIVDETESKLASWIVKIRDEREQERLYNAMIEAESNGG